MDIGTASVDELIQKALTLPFEQQREILREISALREAEAREAAKSSFLEYVKGQWPIFIEGRHHKIVAEAFDRVIKGELKRLIINMAPRHALKLYTPIPTTVGWKDMGTISQGDFVFGPDGRPNEVLGKSLVFKDVDLYKVITSDGASVECDGDHLWTVRFGTSKNGEYKTLTAKALYEHLKVTRYRENGNFPKLPKYDPLQYPEANLLVPPYVLGAWLGDGASSCGTMGAHPDDASHIRARFEALSVPTTDLSTAYIFGTRGLMVKLREIGVLGDKHIPDAYLTASVEQRMELLRGLMDTDGHVTKVGKCEFHTSNPVLADQFVQLIRSFGLKAKLSIRQGFYKGVMGKRAYKICFKKAEAASLPRKASRCRDSEGNWGRSFNIERSGIGDVQCLQTARSDGLFLAGCGFLVTHNTKSEFASVMLPSCFLGHYPSKKIIQCSCVADLAIGFGRDVRDLITTKSYQKVFPGAGLRADSKAAGHWHTNKKGGEYFAIGVEGKVTGKGADLLIIDDPHSEQEAKQAETNPDIFNSVFDWYTSGPRQRLQPDGAIVVVMTRWGKRDLTGRLIKAQTDGDDEYRDKWEVIELPAIMPSGEPMWPEFWKKEALLATKAGLPVSKWSAQYQQTPTSEEGALVKRTWWKEWDEERPPECEYIIQSWDTAYLKTQRADFSACTTWGVFYREDHDTGNNIANIILLNAYAKRMEFPELKKMARKSWLKWRPDSFIVEAKAAGAPLAQELRATGIPVSEYAPSKGNDKIARVNSITDLFFSGMVWYPVGKKWAEEVIEQFAEFPNGDADDLVDSGTQALMRFRKGGFIPLPSDYEDDYTHKPIREYY